jgi:hypothetical protein
MLEVILDPAFVKEKLFRIGLIIDESDFETAVQVCSNIETLADNREIKRDAILKDRRIRRKRNLCHALLFERGLLWFPFE